MVLLAEVQQFSVPLLQVSLQRCLSGWDVIHLVYLIHNTVRLKLFGSVNLIQNIKSWKQKDIHFHHQKIIKMMASALAW